MAQKVPTPKQIQQTLLKYRQGLSKDYDILLSHLGNPLLPDDDLLQYLQGLRSSIAEMDKKVETLIGVVLKIEWTSRGTTLVQEYQNFLLNLVSAHTYYLKAILHMIVLHFYPVIRIPEGEEPEIDEETRNQINIQSLHLHTLLQSVTQIVPMAPKVLLTLVGDMFPYFIKPAFVQQTYVQNLIHIALYMHGYRQPILELIIDKMTRLDEGVTSRTEQKLPLEAVKLDILMEVMLIYVHDTCYSKEQLDWEVTKKMYKELLVIFEKILLPTYASCHVQFVIFYISSFKEALSEGFLDYLWKKVQDPNTQVLFRQAAVAYMASFLARAKFISISTLKAVLDLMVSWVHTYIHQTADLATEVEIRVHSAFYAVCQAIFYVLAFRHKDLLETKDGLQFCRRLNLQTIVMCRLNPLKYCIPAVINTFTCVARQHQLAFCETIIEKNKRNRLPTAGDGGVSHSVSVDSLPNTFFPFDPYLLPRSSAYIYPLYKEYDGNVLPDDEDLENQEEDHYMDVDITLCGSIEKTVISLSPSQKIVKSPLTSSFTDLMMYGVSPGFKHA
ncbi:hypothetical protein LSH36_34g08138 [Paralvinella palmiformis]|uniref:RNA polymerase I-specific transcription initiation factor RRN3 n=1 Tax=Paralvinella palmiformis TaxID=53620 RepID=A0AAD9NH23_9ANNE|nr:hypothetical protein LSH36_34g08138 [Paralvinella palmiformis]